jgi:hypothetical protein
MRQAYTEVTFRAASTQALSPPAAITTPPTSKEDQARRVEALKAKGISMLK